MEQVARRKRKVKTKIRELKEIKKPTKKKSNKSKFENDIVKFGMRRIKEVKTKETTTGNTRITRSRLTVKDGIYAKGYRSETVGKKNIDFGLKLQNDEEFNARINSDLNKIIDLSNLYKPTTSNLKNTSNTNLSQNSNKSCFTIPEAIPVDKQLTASSSKSFLNDNFTDSENITICIKKPNEARACTEKLQQDLIAEAIFDKPICTSHFSLHTSQDHDEKENMDPFNSDVSNRFQYFCSGMTNMAEDLCSKYKINILEDLRKDLKQIHFNCMKYGAKFGSVQSLTSNEDQTLFDNEPYQDLDPDYSEFNEDVTQNYRVNIFPNIDEHHPYYEEQSVENDCEINMSHCNPNNIEYKVNHNEPKQNLDEDLIINKKDMKRKINLETPEYCYNKMNVIM